MSPLLGFNSFLIDSGLVFSCKIENRKNKNHITENMFIHLAYRIITISKYLRKRLFQCEFINKTGSQVRSRR